MEAGLARAQGVADLAVEALEVEALAEEAVPEAEEAHGAGKRILH
jgi:hypothetical protein